MLSSALAPYGRSLLLVGRFDEARDALDESLAIFDHCRAAPDSTSRTSRDGHRARRGRRPRPGPEETAAWAQAARSYFARDFARAADCYEAIGSLTDEAEARLRAARHLIKNGRADEAAEQLERALSFYRSVEATRFVREGEALLAATTAWSAPACGRENADDARFCSACGAQLASELTTREERKVVTCLFCDLVGFTARAERMDPEDVRRLLQPYHALVRGELERFGGSVEKFIGDAVMAVFGAPVAHEDDPERAVRAALAIRER